MYHEQSQDKQGDVSTCRKFTIQEALERCLKKGKSEEQAQAAFCVVLLCVQLGAGPDSEKLFTDIRPVLVTVLADASAGLKARSAVSIKRSVQASRRAQNGLVSSSQKFHLSPGLTSSAPHHWPIADLFESQEQSESVDKAVMSMCAQSQRMHLFPPDSLLDYCLSSAPHRLDS